MIQLSENQVTNVKHVIFGLQKQANVTNEAVVKIVARGISRVSGEAALNSEESFINAVRDYLQYCIDKGFTDDENLIMLIAGEVSLAVLNEMGPKTVYVDQPNPESPKHIFRINKLGEEVSIDMSAESGVYAPASAVPSAPTVDPDAVYDVDDDFYTRARKIKAAILPTIPDAVKENIPDNDWAQALCCAEYFYNYKGAEGSKVALGETKRKVSASEVFEAFVKIGKSVGEIANDYGITADTVKELLRSKKVDVK